MRIFSNAVGHRAWPSYGRYQCALLTASVKGVEMRTPLSAYRHQNGSYSLLLTTQTLESIVLTAAGAFGDLHAITRHDVAANNWATGVSDFPCTLIRAGTPRGATSGAALLQ